MESITITMDMANKGFSIFLVVWSVIIVLLVAIAVYKTRKQSFPHVMTQDDWDEYYHFNPHLEPKTKGANQPCLKSQAHQKVVNQ